MSRRICIAFAFLLAGFPSFASAQHHHHHRHHHHGSHYGHANWNYVVPHSHHHHGGYYVQGSSYYYTPSQIAYLGVSQSNYVPPQVQQPVPLQFGGFDRCDDLTGRLETQLNLFCLELHYNYQHNPDFAHTYREAYDLLQIARRLHALDHAGERQAIQQSVTSLDQQFHHVQEDIFPWTRQLNRHLPPGDAIQKASTAEALLHHLCFVVGVKPHEEPAAGPPGPPGAPPPSVAPGVPALLGPPGPSPN